MSQSAILFLFFFLIGSPQGRCHQGGLLGVHTGFTGLTLGPPSPPPNTSKLGTQGGNWKQSHLQRPSHKARVGPWSQLCPARCPSSHSPGDTFTLWPSTDWDPPENTGGTTGALRAGLATLPPQGVCQPAARTGLSCPRLPLLETTLLDVLKVVHGEAGIGVGQGQGSRSSEPPCSVFP